MMDSVIVAAPLLIAAMVMAFRFVGCGLSTMGLGGASYGGTVGETTGLVGFWQLGDAAGSTTAADSVSGAPNGTYHPGAKPGVTGLVCSSAADGSNTAASFDGVKGYVSVGFNQNLNPPHFTVEALVYPSTITTSAIVSSDTGYQLALNANGSFQASVGSGGSFDTPVVVNAGATTSNGPFYVAMTYDGTNLTLYVNPAASGDQSTLGSDMYQQGRRHPNISRRRAASCGSAPAPAVGHRVISSPARFRTSRSTTGHSASTRSSTTSRAACAVSRPTRAGPPIAVTWPSRATSAARAPCRWSAVRRFPQRHRPPGQSSRGAATPTTSRTGVPTWTSSYWEPGAAARTASAGTAARPVRGTR